MAKKRAKKSGSKQSPNWSMFFIVSLLLNFGLGALLIYQRSTLPQTPEAYFFSEFDKEHGYAKWGSTKSGKWYESYSNGLQVECMGVAGKTQCKEIREAKDQRELDKNWEAVLKARKAAKSNN